MRWAMVDAGTRKARAISSVDKPQRARRVSATRASLERTGWHAMKIRPRRSSPTSSSTSASTSTLSRARSASRPISSCLRSSAWRRRMRSIAWCFAVPISQAPGFSGTPETGHRSSAATRASCARSSAVARSPTMRASPAMSRADSMRQIASIARFASVAGVPVMARAPSHALELEDLTDLEGPAVVGCPLQPLEGLVHRTHLPQPVTGDQLLGLRERPVDDGALLAIETNAPALGARVEPAGLEHHTRLDQLFVELLVLRHRLRGRGGRALRLALLAFLGHYQHTHICLLLSELPRRCGLRLLRPHPLIE